MTDVQLDLFDYAGLMAEEADARQRGDLTAAFWLFHRANPQVYQRLRQFALEARAAGRQRIGIKTLWERVRWYIAIETADPNGLTFKLNNNYHSRYARLLVANEPDLAGLFEFRELRSAPFRIDEREAA